MQLSLKGLIPLPLKDKVSQRTSDVWQKDISFQGSNCIFIKAPSGTGKTTLIHILYGLRKDYEGTVSWGSQNLAGANNESIAALRKEKISVVFQDMRLFPGLTLWENLEVKRLLTNTFTEQQVTEWLSRLGIEQKKNAMASTLSYGEQQRAAIIRALLQPFNWLLMDEPFSHLDHANVQKAIGLINEIVDFNKASLLLADLDDNTYFSYTQTLTL